ncbi:glycosyltransferase [Saccharothrix australiensis]|uniref:Glycosyltransferase involved in cell wall biosynthesis n=1 Tax=Saccharothrix australiensis TaxID=2072 RepID=A0A495W1A1_9PSEU|nr:glycosyltransferase [Saccharothrix australiensis]RKT54485.1 glycosyltransferase involved in cell wall biosynthesis [Saccharothrix australiensis]
MTGLHRAGALVTAAAGLVGVTGYVGTLLLANLLTPAQFVDYSAAQSLVTTAGVAAAALVPLPLARAVRAGPAGSVVRRDSTGFAVLVALLGGAVTAVALTGLGLVLSTPGVAVALGAAGFAVFAISPVWGRLQGEARFGRYAAASVAEVVVRLVASVAAVALGLGSAGAVGGFVVGAVVVAWTGVTTLRGDLAWRPGLLRDRTRWRETGVLASAQLTLSALVGCDVVLVAAVDADSTAGAGYQAVAVMAKGPVYVAASAALAGFPLLRNTAPERTPEVVGAMLGSFTRLALPITAVVATVPPSAVSAVLPDRYAGALGLLPWLAVAGFSFGAISALVMVLLGVGAHARCRAALAVATAVVTGGMCVGWYAAATTGLAVGVAFGASLAALVCAVLVHRFLPARALRAFARAAVLVAGLTVVLLVARSSTPAWLCIAVVAVSAALWPRREPRGRPGASLDILHLGFEDPDMPGAGGGSLRTHEIDRRLVAAGHRVTVLTTRFPGCRDRVQDGVRYVHVGPGRGRTLVGRVLGYAAALPFAARRHAADLVVEDFFAPFSTMGAPLWTGRPTVGVVQWLNARDKARQYHLPFHLVERFGVRRHRRLVAVSRGVADRLTALNPRAHVEVIGNGVDPRAFAATPSDGADVVYIGRLEFMQKGLDLLLGAWSSACAHVTGTLVVAGTGPGGRRLRDLADDLGIADRVRFAGWVTGQAKYDLLARARLVAVPSRFETFGIVAVEALATGTPVLAFDIPCLREVVPAHSGELVTPFDVPAYAEALIRLHRTPKTGDRVRRARSFAAAYDWDALARRQADFYRRAVRERPGTDPVPTGRST